MPEFTGWLLDLFEDPREGLVLYFIDKNGARRRLTRPFPVTFYALGSDAQLRALWRHLSNRPGKIDLSRTQRMDVFKRQNVTVLGVTVKNPYEAGKIFHETAAQFPQIEYADADLHISLRFAAETGAFPLCRCRVWADEGGQLNRIKVLEDAWQPKTIPIPWRIMSLVPDVAPHHAQPHYLIVKVEGEKYHLDLRTWRPLLINLRALIQRHDPDLLLTDWGDTWLLPKLIVQSEKYKVPLGLNREAGRGVSWREERTYFSYGQIIYRGQQIHLFGRCHIDRQNAVLWNDYGLDGTIEVSRVTALPLQTAARVSPGTGISSIEMLTALREGTLVPWQKQQAEMLKPAADLFTADQGGLVYQPKIGVHKNVAEIDFVSLYPAIMVHFNISPETILPDPDGENLVPALGLAIDNSQDGLIPKALRPLLEKRIEMKKHLASTPDWDPFRKSFKHRASALKWLLVTCFGYLGYKNARFGRIEAHQAVTAYGREALLRAKEAAEDMGFEVIQLYVDGLWVHHPEKTRPKDIQPLLLEIQERTGLPISLDGIYRWVVFVGSRQNKKRPVANRYFGVFQDGSIKVRGIDARRRDSTPFVSEAQMHLLELLASKDQPEEALPEAVDYLKARLRALRNGHVRLPDLLVRQRLGRKLEAYRTPSPAARAVMQLQAVGKEMRPGQRVPFLYTLGKPGVFAWDRPQAPNPRMVDVARYQRLLLRAAGIVLESWGLDEEKLTERVLSGANQLHLPVPRKQHPRKHRSNIPGIVDTAMDRTLKGQIQ
ncbi:MAG: DNA polymerase domain-containing protein [Chloroflexota bacterium]|nr:DNA polymerase domain-containing protein [Chloroflexota bacterium]